MNFGITLMLLWLIQCESVRSFYAHSDLVFAALQDPTAERWLSWMYAALLIFCSFMASFFRSHSLLQMAVASITVRNMLITAVYQKATKLSSKASALLSIAV
jgi:hypothetical protein